MDYLKNYKTKKRAKISKIYFIRQKLTLWSIETREKGYKTKKFKLHKINGRAIRYTNKETGQKTYLSAGNRYSYSLVPAVSKLETVSQTFPLYVPPLHSSVGHVATSDVTYTTNT